VRATATREAEKQKESTYYIVKGGKDVQERLVEHERTLLKVPAEVPPGSVRVGWEDQRHFPQGINKILCVNECMKRIHEQNPSMIQSRLAVRSCEATYVLQESTSASGIGRVDDLVELLDNGVAEVRVCALGGGGLVACQSCRRKEKKKRRKKIVGTVSLNFQLQHKHQRKTTSNNCNRRDYLNRVEGMLECCALNACGPEGDAMR
jgi:hypothetical protein